MRVLAANEVRQIEAGAASRTDTSASLLIQRAGYAVAQFCLVHFKFRSVCVVCGAGDNGATAVKART
jgi:NAD(P)H-hydrate repair Nnr-like enzyme with NAD(P)H-hydrate epimerase domain